MPAVPNNVRRVWDRQDAELERRVRVIEGPYGHWYAIHEGELLALPITATEAANPHQPPPRHPSAYPDGWYSPDDLGDEERREILEELER